MEEPTIYKCPKCGFTGTVEDFDVIGADGDNWFCNECGAQAEMEMVKMVKDNPKDKLESIRSATKAIMFCRECKGGKMLLGSSGMVCENGCGKIFPPATCVPSMLLARPMLAMSYHDSLAMDCWRMLRRAWPERVASTKQIKSIMDLSEKRLNELRKDDPNFLPKD